MDLLAVHRLADSTGFFDRPSRESFDSLHTTGPQSFMTSSGIHWELESAGDCFALGPLGSMLHAQTERDGPVRYGGCLVAAHRRGHVGEVALGVGQGPPGGRVLVGHGVAARGARGVDPR